MNVSAPKPSPIPRYNKCTKLMSSSIFGFFQLGVKLGFDFPKVSPNQKSQPRSLKFDFDEEINPMLGSLKNLSSTRSPNFPHGKLKTLGIEFLFDRKMCPSMESQPSILLWRETQKVRIPSFYSCTISSSQVSSDTMLVFQHLS